MFKKLDKERQIMLGGSVRVKSQSIDVYIFRTTIALIIHIDIGANY